jgi:CheY-specific phosphatase CheX
VGLRCGTDLLRDLVSAVFGEIVSDEELESRGADLLAELANTVAGRLAGAIGSEGAQVRVGLPERGRGDFEGVGQPLAYQLDDGRRFEVLLQLTDG